MDMLPVNPSVARAVVNVARLSRLFRNDDTAPLRALQIQQPVDIVARATTEQDCEVCAWHLELLSFVHTQTGSQEAWWLPCLALRLFWLVESNDDRP